MKKTLGVIIITWTLIMLTFMIAGILCSFNNFPTNEADQLGYVIGSVIGMSLFYFIPWLCVAVPLLIIRWLVK